MLDYLKTSFFLGVLCAAQSTTALASSSVYGMEVENHRTILTGTTLTLCRNISFPIDHLAPFSSRDEARLALLTQKQEWLVSSAPSQSVDVQKTFALLQTHLRNSKFALRLAKHYLSNGGKIAIASGSRNYSWIDLDLSIPRMWIRTDLLKKPGEFALEQLVHNIVHTIDRDGDYPFLWESGSKTSLRSLKSTIEEIVLEALETETRARFANALVQTDMLFAEEKGRTHKSPAYPFSAPIYNAVDTLLTHRTSDNLRRAVQYILWDLAFHSFSGGSYTGERISFERTIHEAIDTYISRLELERENHTRGTKEHSAITTRIEEVRKLGTANLTESARRLLQPIPNHPQRTELLFHNSEKLFDLYTQEHPTQDHP